MTDSLKYDLIDVNFVIGEQPHYSKFTGIYTQFKNAVEFIDKAIGDLYSGQINQSSSGLNYQLETLSSVGPNLSRTIGSSGWTNPRHIGRIRLTNKEVIICGHQSVDTDPPTKDGFNHYNKTQFRLPYPPIQFTSTATNEAITYQNSWDAAGWTIGSPGVGYVDLSATYTTRVNNISDLNANSEYHVSDDGLITLWRPLASNEAFKITYTCDTIWDSYDGATLNVIPDFSQTGNLCTVASVGSGQYDITLPITTKRRGRTINSISTTLFPWTIQTTDNNASITDGMNGYQAVLPLSLTNNLSSGDTIPEGSIYLWDSTANQILSEGTYTYRATNQVRVSGLKLNTGGGRYRLVIPGTELSPIVSQMRENLYWQDHSGRLLSDGTYLGNRVSHSDLLNLIDEGDGTDPTYYPSTLGPTRNPHPMYLHRNGDYTDGGVTAGNRNNAMRGTLVINDSITRVLNATVASNPAKTTVPTANMMYAKNMIKAWGKVEGGYGNAALISGFNISAVAVSGIDIDVTFLTNMANANYIVLLSPMNSNARTTRYYATTHAVGGFKVNGFGYTGVDKSIVTGASRIFGFIVIGEQS